MRWVYALVMRQWVVVALLVELACEKQPTPPPTLPAVVDAATVPAPISSLEPCVVHVDLTRGRVTLTGGGLSGGDVTALRAVASTCSARVEASDDVTFEDVARVVALVGQQGIHEVRLGQPVGQWMAMDLGRVTKLWSAEPASALIAAVKEDAPRLGSETAAIVEQVLAAMAKAAPDVPLGTQTSDRGMFEAVAQIVGLRRATSPVSIDLLDRVVLPALQVSSATPTSKAGTGVELFEAFVGTPAKVEGLLGAIPEAELSAPYTDGKPIAVLAGDWTVVATPGLATRLAGYDQRALIAKYDRFVERSNQRDDDRVLVDLTGRALAELAECVVLAVKHRHTLVFRVLPGPLVAPSNSDRNLPTVEITRDGIVVAGKPGPVMASLPSTSPRTIAIEADRTLTYGRVRAVIAALAAPGQVTFVLRLRGP